MTFFLCKLSGKLTFIANESFLLQKNRSVKHKVLPVFILLTVFIIQPRLLHFIFVFNTERLWCCQLSQMHILHPLMIPYNKWSFTHSVMVFPFWFNDLFFQILLQVRPDLQRLPKEYLWGLLKHDFVKTIRPSSHPSNSVEAMKGRLFTVRAYVHKLVIKTAKIKSIK